MGYAPSPRPTFSQPTHIRYDKVERHLWGDPDAGQVSDWIYVSSQEIHQLMFGLAPRGSFRHSDSFRTIFAADEVLYVLSGVMMIANPEVGEVHRVLPGQAAFFRRDTWHHVFNHSAEPLRVLEYFAPPPSQGTSGSYAQTQPYLQQSRYAQDRWMGAWPMARAEAAAHASIQVITESDLLWRLEGSGFPMPVGFFAATEHLTVGKIRLLPGQASELRSHQGDQCLYLLSGSLNVFTPEAEGQRWFELSPKDGFYLPRETPYEFHNITGEATEFIFGVAPQYEDDGTLGSR